MIPTNRGFLNPTGGMPEGFRELLDRKYDILGQEAGSGRISAEAQATNAATAQGLAPATIAENMARAGLLQAQAVDVPLAGRSQRAVDTAQIGKLGAETDLLSFRPTRRQLSGMFSSTFGIPTEGTVNDMTVDPDRLGFSMGTRVGFAKGTAMVPGKGDGTKDTVPAKLAPGEAVLNKAAAQSVGRGLIAALNAAGARKMGLV